MASVEKKRLEDLRVVDIKNELEKRGKDKTGTKPVLAERLQEALRAEGINPSDFLFEVVETPRKSIQKNKVADVGEVSEIESVMETSELDASSSSHQNGTQDSVDQLSNSPEQDKGQGNLVTSVEKVDDSVADCEDDQEIPEHEEQKLLACDTNDIDVELIKINVLNTSRASDTTKVDVSSSAVDDSQQNTTAPVPEVSLGDVKTAPVPEVSLGDVKTAPVPEVSLGDGKSAPVPEVSLGDAKSAPIQPEVKKETVPAATQEGVESILLKLEDAGLVDIDADLHATSQGKGAAEDKKKVSTVKAAEKRPANTDTTPGLAEVADTSISVKPTSNGEKDSQNTDKSANVTNDDKVAQNDRNLWVSGLSSSSRATDLKSLFGKYGKVIAAKVVTNARSPGSRCYGFVTMGSTEEASKCIQHLHRTELHGRMISVERAKTELQGAKAKVLPPSNIKTPKKTSHSTSSRKSDKKESSKDEKHKPHKAESYSKSKKDANLLSFEKIQAVREREQLRRREIILRQEDRKRQLALAREHHKQMMIEKQQREEAIKLVKEKRRLREMREEIERERIETERLKLETERLQIKREQEAYLREKRALQESRRAAKRAAESAQEEHWSSKRPATDRYTGTDREPKYERKVERYEEGKRYEEGRSNRVEHRHEGRTGSRHESGRFKEERPVREHRESRGRGDESRHVYREERPREKRVPRESKHEPRHSTRTDWNTGRDTTRSSGTSWTARENNHWASNSRSMGTNSWSTGVVISQPAGFVQPMMTGAVGSGTVFIAQPAAAMQGAPVMVPGNLTHRQSDRYSLTSSRRF